MNRYQRCFTRCKAHNEGAFIPFVMLGDPDIPTSFAIIETLIAAGADGLELGIPFSDPLADGPTIQNAAQRAFKAGITPDHCFALLAQIRAQYPEIPIGLLVYANLVYRKGIEAFYQQCQNAGVDSVLVADVPLHEAHPFYQAAQTYHIAPVFICPPNADAQLITQIAQYGAGYTYLLSRAGITGTEQRAAKPIQHLLTLLAEAKAPPPVQGFGISEPSQVKAAIDAGSAGAISGSAVVNIIAQHLDDPETMHRALTEFIQAMKQATKIN